MQQKSLSYDCMHPDARGVAGDPVHVAEMPSRNLDPNMMRCNAALRMCEKGTHWQYVRPNVITYSVPGSVWGQEGCGGNKQ